MKLGSPKVSAFVSAVLISLFIVLAFVFLAERTLLENILIGIISFSVCYLIVRQSVQYFLYRKIKLIYRTIYTLKSTSLDEKIREDLKRTDPLDEVNKNVQKWAKDKSTEIEQLKGISKYKQDFFGNVSHELKTPIFNLQGYLYTLLDGAIDDESVRVKFMQKAKKSADRLELLVQELLSINELESGRRELNRRDFNLSELVKEIFEELEYKATQANIRLELNEESVIPIMVNADRKMIRQVLLNLIDNSIKYGKKGGKSSADFFEMDKHVLVEISDDGSGIAEEHLSRLFERFYRTDSARSRDNGGTGLGLAIVKHIVEAHGEKINVRSAITKGTTFGFSLKRA